jgi:hypothetical protein
MSIVRKKEQQGVALVVTVIVVAMLAVVAVAMMQSNSVDRLSSRSVANSYSAQLAAQAGAAAAQSLVAGMVAKYPDSVTVWQNIGGGAINGVNNEATVLCLRADSSDSQAGASPAAFGDGVVLLGLPLVSRTGASPSAVASDPVPLAQVVSLLPFDEGSMVNLNATNNSYSTAFVGSRSSTNPGAPVTAAQWIYLTKYGGPVSATNPYVARYAFWVEDESFKVNLNVITNGERGVQSLGLSPEEARLDGSWGSSSNSLQDADFKAVVSERENFSGGLFPSALTAAFPAGLDSGGPEVAGEIRFLSTTFSRGLNFSRGGFPRFPLTQETVGTNDIRAIKRIVAAITNSNASPTFGQRFYKDAADATGNDFARDLNEDQVDSEEHADAYVMRIAANIKDVIDSDSVPTIVTSPNGKIAGAEIFDNKTASNPEEALAIEVEGGGTLGAPVLSGDRVLAVGKESLPRLQEYAIHGRIISFDPVGYNSKPGDANFEITIDHYLEFWNPGSKPFDLENCFIKIYDMPTMDLGGGSSTPDLTAPDRVVTLRIEEGVIPAGGIRVITTAPADQINANLKIPAPEVNIISATIEEGDREFSGTTRKTDPGRKATNSQGVVFSNSYKISTDYRDGSVGSGSTDYGTTMVLGNSTNGYIDSLVGLPLSAAGGVKAFDLDARIPQKIAPATRDNYYVRAGSLMGNSTLATVNTAGLGDPVAAVGDPSTLNEALEMLIYITGGKIAEQTRFLNTSPTDGGPLPGQSSLGKPNASYVVANKWPDCSPVSGAPAFIFRDSNLGTIGELGYVADPARFKSDASTVARVRGGGRTLKVGQSERYEKDTNRAGLWDGDPVSKSRTRVAWRLADVFSAKSATSIPGLINPNGALRDGGAAMRAALYGLAMVSGSEGSPGTGGKDVALSNFLSGTNTNSPGIVGYLTNSTIQGQINPFWERGEISELGGPYAIKEFVSGAGPAADVYDRSREEIARRSIEMITTRGSVFTVYAIGQALQVTQGATNVLSTARMKQTFELVPVLPSGSQNNSFDPDNPSSVKSRFAPVTEYATSTLQSTYE